jgi:hypothetical protein
VYLERPADGSTPLLYAAPYGLSASGSASAISGAGGIPAAVSSSSISSLASAGQPASTPGRNLPTLQQIVYIYHTSAPAKLQRHLYSKHQHANPCAIDQMQEVSSQGFMNTIQ